MTQTKTYDDLIADIDKKIQQNDEALYETRLPPGTKFIEVGMHGLKRMYGVCKASDFQKLNGKRNNV